MGMASKIVVIDGHPDPSAERYCHALAKAYADGARNAGHSVRLVTVSECDVAFVRSGEEWRTGQPSPAIRQAQEAIGWADHLVIIYPLWLGSMPALMKAFFEQAFRPGFAVKPEAFSLRPGLLNGRSARIVVTMGMPAWVYRWFFFAHSLKSLERNILKFAGIGPIRETLIGGVESIGDAKRQAWLDRLSRLGSDAK
jgi:putative NADPH-quinone reductase